MDIARGSGALKIIQGIYQHLDVERDHVPDFIVANSTDNILWCKETFMGVDYYHIFSSSLSLVVAWIISSCDADEPFHNRNM
jgi:hypothetical protein